MAKKDAMIEEIDESPVVPVEAGTPAPSGPVRTLAADHKGAPPLNPHSPTGVSKSKITLADYQVTVRSKAQGLVKGVIHKTVGQTAAIREFMLKYGLNPGQCSNVQAFKMEGTEVDAGEAGYHSDQIDGKRPAREMQPV